MKRKTPAASFGATEASAIEVMVGHAVAGYLRDANFTSYLLECSEEQKDCFVEPEECGNIDYCIDSAGEILDSYGKMLPDHAREGLETLLAFLNSQNSALKERIMKQQFAMFTAAKVLELKDNWNGKQPAFRGSSLGSF